MKVLLIPLDYHRHTEDSRFFGDMLSAFNKQAKAMIYQGNMDEAIAFNPDVIFYQGSLTELERHLLKQNTKAIWTTWTGDVRYAPMQYLRELRGVTDIYLLPFGGDLLNIYSVLLDKPCKFIFEPFQDWRFKEPKLLLHGKISFVGNLYEHLPGGKERAEISEFISKHVPELECYGSGFPKGQINNFDVHNLYNDSYLVIADNNWNDIQDYFTPRNLVAMAAGSCCLMRTFPGIERHFKNLEHCVYYNHKYELLDIINFLKHNPGIRDSIANKGYKHVKENYNMDNWVRQYLNQIKN